MNTKEKFKCKVCGKEFDDGWTHALTSKDGFQVPMDKAHAQYIDKNRNDGDICMCGGTIITYSWGDEDCFGWETKCSQCDFLYDED
jgi:hypothetical protein